MTNKELSQHGKGLRLRTIIDVLRGRGFTYCLYNERRCPNKGDVYVQATNIRMQDTLVCTECVSCKLGTIVVRTRRGQFRFIPDSFPKDLVKYGVSTIKEVEKEYGYPLNNKLEFEL